MTRQNTDARVIELHEKQKAMKKRLRRGLPRGKKARAKLIARAATVQLFDPQEITAAREARL